MPFYSNCCIIAESIEINWSIDIKQVDATNVSTFRTLLTTPLQMGMRKQDEHPRNYYLKVAMVSFIDFDLCNSRFHIGMKYFLILMGLMMLTQF